MSDNSNQAGTSADEQITDSFSRLDTDHDGLVTGSDLLAVVVRVATTAGLQTGVRPARDAIDLFHRLWLAITAQLRVNLDAQLTPQLFHTGVRRLLTAPGGYERFLEPALGALIEVADTDHNGHLNADEWTHFMAGFRIGASQAAAYFHTLDNARTGQLTREQVLAATSTIYSSDIVSVPAPSAERQ